MASGAIALLADRKSPVAQSAAVSRWSEFRRCVIGIAFWTFKEVVRATALFLGLFAITNFVGDAVRSGFSARDWWLDLGPLPATFAGLWELLAGLSLLAAVFPVPSVPLRQVCTAVLTATLLLAVGNALQFHRLDPSNAILSGVFPVVSLVVVLTIAGSLALVWSKPRPVSRASWWLPVGLAPVVAILFALLQISLFSRVDDRRPADAAVVFGCRVYRSGQPSHALADRVRTAVELYRLGLVRELWLSGGPGEGSLHETEAMRSLAIAQGVPAAAIRLDRLGLDTASTVRNTVDWLGPRPSGRLLAVSHGYHLPRIKLCFQRSGREVFTVPARQRYIFPNQKLLTAREVAAFWWYYLLPGRG